MTNFLSVENHCSAKLEPDTAIEVISDGSEPWRITRLSRVLRRIMEEAGKYDQGAKLSQTLQRLSDHEGFLIVMWSDREEAELFLDYIAEAWVAEGEAHVVHRDRHGQFADIEIERPEEPVITEPV